MYWIFAAIFIVIALVVPRLRPLGIAGCVVLAVLLAWAVTQRLRDESVEEQRTTQQRRPPAAPAPATQSIPVDDIVAEDLRLSGGGAPFELQGRIANRTRDMLLKSVTIRVERRDCYEGALDPSGCVLLWEDRPWINLSVPPRQSRDFSVSVWMRGAAPGARGTLQDTFEIVAASGQRATDGSPELPPPL